MLLGCIGDDFTGSSDLANTLAKQGMRTVQYTGVPDSPAAQEVEAGVVALKSRSIEPDLAVKQSLEALEWLVAQGCEQFFFKYCSTFDSTPEGNIGPVAEALADALDANPVIFCPAFPGTGRSIYQGHLFVNDVLLNESGMQNHPLTPMTDPDLRRWLSHQTKCDIGHVPIANVLAGASAIGDKLQEERQNGKRFVIVDALQDGDLLEIGKTVADAKLITGGSGVALGLPSNFIQKGKIRGTQTHWKGESGQCVAISGSCSTATRNQVAIHSKQHPSFELMAEDVINGVINSKEVAAWAMRQEGIPLVFSSADPDTVQKVQQKFGREKSAEAIEHFFAELAQNLVELGVSCLLTAGGESSGAVVEGLKLNTLEIGPEIDPGVPALRAGDNLVIALKSGNFGSPDYFEKAAGILKANAK